MRNVLKRFGVRDTASFDEYFHNSLWKLTLLYTVVLATILVISSGVIYGAFSQKLGRRYGDFRIIPTDRPGVAIVQTRPLSRQDVQDELIYSLILVNGILLLVAGAASYGLARVTLRPIKDAYDRQRRFFADASHELRTPLSILKIDLENEIANPNASLIAKTNAKGYLEEVDRMSTLVTNLLTLSRVHDERTLSPTNLKILNLSSLVRGVCERLTPLAGEHAVTITMHEEKNDIMATSDEQLLSSSIENVIKNAILYNKPQGTVTVNLRQTITTIVIEIIDTGIGIAPKDFLHVFERFYRTDKSRSRATGGSGLGLPIVRSSIEKLGGKVYIKSTLEKGTTVTLELPL